MRRINPGPLGWAFICAVAWMVAASLFLSISGCAENPLTSDERSRMTYRMQLHEIRGQVEAGTADVLAYANQPKCSQTIVLGCADPAIVKALTEVAAKAYDAVNEAQAMLDIGKDPDAAITLARVAANKLAVKLLEEKP